MRGSELDPSHATSAPSASPTHATPCLSPVLSDRLPAVVADTRQNRTRTPIGPELRACGLFCPVALCAAHHKSHQRNKWVSQQQHCRLTRSERGLISDRATGCTSHDMPLRVDRWLAACAHARGALAAARWPRGGDGVLCALGCGRSWAWRASVPPPPPFSFTCRR
jgi:hypothetical protein